MYKVLQRTAIKQEYKKKESNNVLYSDPVNKREIRTKYRLEKLSNFRILYITKYFQYLACFIQLYQVKGH